MRQLPNARSPRSRILCREQGLVCASDDSSYVHGSEIIVDVRHHRAMYEVVRLSIGERGGLKWR